MPTLGVGGEDESVKSLSRVQLFATPWMVAHQVPLTVEFSRQEYGSGLPFPSPGDLPKTGIKPRFPALQAYSLPTELSGKPLIYDRPSAKIITNGEKAESLPSTIRETNKSTITSSIQHSHGSASQGS